MPHSFDDLLFFRKRKFEVLGQNQRQGILYFLYKTVVLNQEHFITHPQGTFNNGYRHFLVVTTKGRDYDWHLVDRNKR